MEGNVDVTNFCEKLRHELIDWKAKAYDLLRAMDRRSETDKEKAGVSMDDLGRTIDQIEKKLKRLETQCPTNWDAERVELETMIAELETKWGEAAEMSPDDFD